ncbi:barstar family protein [Streptomyces canus]|uniref:barstar family protein n=1 Tax=Streptomyces canus TaxID=58343 RepID=UPI0038011A64
MKISPLWTDSPPWVRVIPADANISIVDALPSTGSAFTARMQGLEMSDADGVFTQFYENLHLPSYFGWNWDALRDCVEDLSWISVTRYQLIIDDADSVLTGSPDERRTLFRVLSGAAEYWEKKPDFAEKMKVTFRVLLLCRPEACTEFRKELARF